MIDLRLALPIALLLLLALPALLLLARWRLAPLPRHVRLTAIGLRLLIVVLVILATAGPRLTSAADTLTLVVVADRSDSVLPSAGQVDQAVEALRQRAGARDQIGMVEFGRDAVVLQAPGGEMVVPTPRTAGDATNLDQALRVAASLFPPTGSHRVLLLTDGRETGGDAAAAAASLAAAGIEVDVLPLAPGTASSGSSAAATVLDVAVDRVESPTDVREGDALDVSVVLHSTAATTTRLEVWVDEQSVLDQPVELAPGETRVPLPLRAVGEGFHSFRARVTTEGDAYPQNNELSAETVVHPRARVLLVSEQPAAAPLRAALVDAGAEVTPVDPGALPAQALALRDFDLVVLDNLPASAFNQDQTHALGEYVEQLGKGLIVVGGDQAFSLGDYSGTPLEDVLPVKARPPSREQRPSVALLLIIDKSGSMALGSGRTSKMAMARQAAVLATQALDDEDQVGVLAFDDSNTWAVPFQKLGDRANRSAIEARIGQIDASGGTEIAPALAEGLPAIEAVQAGVKHVVLLTDGQSVSPRRRYDQILDRFRRDRITLSTIAVGKDSDQELLKRLAEQGRGRYYYTETPDDIPRLVMGEARMVSSPAYVVGNFQPRVTNAGPILQSIDPASLPQLGGYAVTVAKPQADVVLVSPREDPILAGWQYGLGRSLAFTSGLDQVWGSEWLAWSDIGRFLSGAMRWVAARPGGENLDTSAVAADGRTTVRVTSVHDDGSFGDLLTTEAEIAGPTAETQLRVPLRQIGPGTYEAAVDTPAQGAYALRVTQREGDAVLYQQLSGFVVGYPAEYRPGPANLPLLETIAARTGGRVLSDPTEALRRSGPPQGRETHDLWWPLVALALLLFPLDIAVRRFRWEWPARLRLGSQT